MKNAPPMDGCQSVFRAGSPTKDAYTNVWIKLISTIEKNKNVHIDKKFTETTQLNDISRNGMACPAEGEWDDD